MSLTPRELMEEREAEDNGTNTYVHRLYLNLDKMYDTPLHSPLHHDNRWCTCKQEDETNALR